MTNPELVFGFLTYLITYLILGLLTCVVERLLIEKSKIRFTEYVAILLLWPLGIAVRISEGWFKLLRILDKWEF